MKLTQLHDRILKRIQALSTERRGARQRCAFFIEHGLSADEVAALSSVVGKEIKRQPPRRGGWDAQWATLAVVATEVGYVYRGANTEYWPLLEEAIGAPLNPDDQRAVHRMFDQAADLTGVRPPDTAWSRQFVHITWPITHAVLPLELHARLAEAIRASTSPEFAQLPSDWLLGQLSVWARDRGDGRLLDFLARGEVAATIIRYLLDPEVAPAGLSPGFLRRVRDDTRRDRLVERALQAARGRAARASLARVTRQPAGSEVPAPPTRRPVALALDVLDTASAPRLMFRAPVASTDLTERARATLHGVRARLRPFGGRRSVSALDVVLGRPLDLTWGALRDGGAPLFTDTSPVAEFDKEVAEWLGSLEARLEHYTIFDAPGDDGLAWAVEPANRRRDIACFVLCREAARPPGHSWEVGGWTVTQLQDAGLQWLDDVGLQQDGEPVATLALECVGPPHVGEPSSLCPSRLRGEQPVILLPSGAVRLDGTTSPWAGGLAEIVLPEQVKQWRLVYEATEGALGEVMGAVVPRAPQAPDPVSLSLNGPIIDAPGLADRQLTLAVDASRPLSGLEVTASLIAEGVAVWRATTLLRDPTPTAIPRDHDIWVGAAAEAAARVGTPLTLRAEIGALAWEEWALPWPPAAPLSAANIEGAWYSFDSPLEPAAHEPPEGGIHVPDDGGRPLCTGPTRSDLLLSLRRPERILRRVTCTSAEPPRRIDVGRLAALAVAWRRATAATPVLAIRQGKAADELDGWLVEALCGRRWADAERSLEERSVPAFGEMFADAAQARRLGRDAECEQTFDSPEHRSVMAERLRDEWVRWASEHQGALLDADIDPLAPSFDEACNRAYEAAGAALGLEVLDADVYTTPLKLELAAEVACSRWLEAKEISALFERILPRLPGRSLALLSHEGAPTRALVAGLTRWLRARPSAVVAWDEPAVGALLELFLRPGEATVAQAELRALGWAVADRAAAQAIRYSALRRGRRPLRGGPR